MEIRRIEELPSQIWTIPNILTFLRILLLPIIILCLERKPVWGYGYAVIIGLFMITSDLLDGYLARKLNQRSKIGSILDALSDKIIVDTLAVYFVIIREIPIFIPLVFILRDVLVGMAAIKFIKMRRNIVSPMIWGRLSSLVAGFSFILLVIGIKVLFWIMITIALSLILYSGIEYVKLFRVVRK